MKSIKLILIATLIAFVSVAQAQKKITISDVYEGKTVVQIAKDHATEAFNATKTIYTDGMTEEAFVNECFKNFPSKYDDLRQVFKPYAEFLFSLHSRNLTDNQVRNQVNGSEFVDCSNAVLAWQLAHPGENLDGIPWWRKTIHWVAVFFTWLDEILD